jgi:drug/metabolite transporter (DMT)-like permease
MAATRMGLAAIVFLPVWRKIIDRPPAIIAWRWAVIAGVALALHFASWLTSLSYTSIVASTTLVTTSPLWVALFTWGWQGVAPRRLTCLGMGFALIGSFLIGSDGSSASPTHAPLLGNTLALIGAIAASLYFLSGRLAQQQGLSIRHYAAIAYTTAAIVLLPLPIVCGADYFSYSCNTYSYLGLMALVPQIIGHTSLNWAMRWVSPLFVTLVILLEPVFAGFLGFFLFQEQPGLWMMLGAGVLLIGIAIAARDQ